VLGHGVEEAAVLGRILLVDFDHLLALAQGDLALASLDTEGLFVEVDDDPLVEAGLGCHAGAVAQGRRDLPRGFAEVALADVPNRHIAEVDRQADHRQGDHHLDQRYAALGVAHALSASPRT
jgi:hypothetical protein